MEQRFDSFHQSKQTRLTRVSPAEKTNSLVGASLQSKQTRVPSAEKNNSLVGANSQKKNQHSVHQKMQTKITSTGASLQTKDRPQLCGGAKVRKGNESSHRSTSVSNLSGNNALSERKC